MKPTELNADLLDIYQTAAALGVSVSTVYVWNDRGYIPAPIEYGGRLRWRFSELKAWVAAGCPRRQQPTKKGAKAKR